MICGNMPGPIAWLTHSWTTSLERTQGWLIPILCAYMLIHACRKLKGESLEGSLHGLWFIATGFVLYLASIRTLQPRIAVASIPFLLSGIVWCYWGGRATIRCAFPFFFILISAQPPNVYQATTGLQILSTEAANWIIQLFGIQTRIEGTSVTLISGTEQMFNINGGCSGLHSLTALLTISCTWAYLSDNLALWKRLILALSAFPLAIITNILRISSIFICSEFISPVFASKTWHDWSGLLLFFPIGVIGLTILHDCLSGRVPFSPRRKVVISKRSNQAQ